MDEVRTLGLEMTFPGRRKTLALCTVFSPPLTSSVAPFTKSWQYFLYSVKEKKKVLSTV